MKVSYKRKTVEVHAFAVTDRTKVYGSFENGVLYASISENCDCSSGILEGGIGITPYYLNGEAVVFPDELARIRFFFLLQIKFQLVLCEFKI